MNLTTPELEKRVRACQSKLESLTQSEYEGRRGRRILATQQKYDEEYERRTGHGVYDISIWDRAVQTRRFLNATQAPDAYQKEREFRGFMSVFFPDFDKKLTDEAALDIRNRHKTGKQP